MRPVCCCMTGFGKCHRSPRKANDFILPMLSSSYASSFPQLNKTTCACCLDSRMSSLHKENTPGCSQPYTVDTLPLFKVFVCIGTLWSIILIILLISPLLLVRTFSNFNTNLPPLLRGSHSSRLSGHFPIPKVCCCLSLPITSVS